jgi:hypothetical protein
VERLAAAGGAEEKSRLHAEFLTQRRVEAKAQRDFISVFAGRIKIQNTIRRFAHFYSLQRDFPFKDATAEGNLSEMFGKIRLVAGCNFYFLCQKLGYHLHRLGNWNWLIKQQ